jgi:hypothetical protein
MVSLICGIQAENKNINTTKTNHAKVRSHKTRNQRIKKWNVRANKPIQISIHVHRENVPRKQNITF